MVTNILKLTNEVSKVNINLLRSNCASSKGAKLEIQKNKEQKKKKKEKRNSLSKHELFISGGVVLKANIIKGE